MSLTQTAHRTNPSWDETIVPALRQRLQDESRLLAKRISNISASSNEDAIPAAIPLTASSSRSTTHTTTHTHNTTRTTTSNSSIASSSRPLTSRSQQNDSQTSARSRTFSQPPAFNRPNTAASGDSSSSRPTRIPKALKSPTLPTPRSPPLETIPASSSPFASAADLWEPPRHPNLSSSSIIHTPPSHKFTNPMLSHEVPPFRAGSFTSITTGESSPFSDPQHHQFQHQLHQYQQQQQQQYRVSRSSLESEERPFEHWYRGESSRNGGVGELRVGNRREMLEIANYGHALQANKLTQRDYYGRDTRKENNAALYSYDAKKKRRRADSVGVRGSLYIDDRHVHEHGPSVIDEAPLTDIELDDEGYGDEYDDEFVSRSPTPTAGFGIRSHQNMNMSMDMDMGANGEMSKTSIEYEQTPTPTPGTPRTPTPAQASRTRPNSVAMRSMTEPLPRPSVSSASSSSSASPRIPPAGSPSPPPATSTPPTSNPRFNNKRRATSPIGSSSPSTPSSKRINGTASPQNTPMRERQLQREREREKQRAREKAERERKSVGKYTIDIEEGDGDIMHAIPSWTQPVGKGNWDDVVLPAVARKKGLDSDGSYEKTDGSPKPKLTPPAEPAPGTFGYDYTKYRPPRAEDESIPLDEFGQMPAIQEQGQQQHQPPHHRTINKEEIPLPPPSPAPSISHDSLPNPHPSMSQTEHDKVALPERNRMNLTTYPVYGGSIHSPPSPAPFSHYHEHGGGRGVEMENKGQNYQPHDQRVEEEPSGGCCACVVM